MDNSLIIVDKTHPQCTIIALNRPAKRNALTIDLMDALCFAIEEVQKEKEQRVIIIKGEGPVFCAGLDMTEAQDISLEEHSSQSLGKFLKTMNECPLITIAAVHGAALGGGAGLACACDLAIAEPGTTFGFPETRRGLVAAQIMPFLIRLFSSRVLNELLFLGETINTERALEIGLINKIATTHSVFAEALKFVDSIVLGAPQATANTKKLIRELEPVDFAKGFELGLTMHREGRQSKESKEGMQAFLEKRPPYWVKK